MYWWPRWMHMFQLVKRRQAWVPDAWSMCTDYCNYWSACMRGTSSWGAVYTDFYSGWSYGQWWNLYDVASRVLRDATDITFWHFGDSQPSCRAIGKITIYLEMALPIQCQSPRSVGHGPAAKAFISILEKYFWIYMLLTVEIWEIFPNYALTLSPPFPGRPVCHVDSLSSPIPGRPVWRSTDDLLNFLPLGVRRSHKKCCAPKLLSRSFDSNNCRFWAKKYTFYPNLFSNI
jgi:hypothetical protein